MDETQFLQYIIRPTLQRLSYYRADIKTLAAERLVLGTCMVESDLKYVRQLNDGVALGIGQMEPESHDDLWENFINYRRELGDYLKALMTKMPKHEQLVTNLAYSVAMMRLQYWRQKEALPDNEDYMGMARYHKIYYNSILGKSETSKTNRIFEKAIKISKELENGSRT